MRSAPAPTATTFATRLAFFAAGFAMACWAPLVPYAKSRLGVDDAQLGMILLCLGIGSLLTMPLTGWLSAQWDSRPMIVAGGIGLAILLPVLAFTHQVYVLAVALLGFGGSLGTLDVAMNVHAVEVERRVGRPLMSNFHAMFSVGGIAGAGGMTSLLGSGVTPAASAILCSLVTMAAIAIAWPRTLPAHGQPTAFVAPHGVVILLAALTAIAFLVEGAILDWGALLVIGARLVDARHAGLGYVLFSVAMAIGRLSGDRVVARIGDRRALVGGGLVAIAGFAGLLTAARAPVAFAGFLMVGLGASNIVPVLFRLTGRQRVMPVGLAIAALTTTGYAGILAGPAAIGFVSHALGLRAAFWMLAALIGLIPLTATLVATDRSTVMRTQKRSD